MMLEMIRACPDFDIVGHFDYFTVMCQVRIEN